MYFSFYTLVVESAHLYMGFPTKKHQDFNTQVRGSTDRVKPFLRTKAKKSWFKDETQ